MGYFKLEVVLSKPKKTYKKRLIIFIIIASFFLFGVYIFKANIDPVIISVSEKKTLSLAGHAVTLSIEEVMSQDLGYNDIIIIKYTTDGKISHMAVNSVVANIITKKLAHIVYNNLITLGKDGIDISLGTLTGMPIFTEKGPYANFEVMPISTVSCNLSSDFTSAGINQTIHKLYANVSVDIAVIIPGLRDKLVKVNTSVVLAENIIVGEIPSTYLAFGKIDSSLNLVP